MKKTCITFVGENDVPKDAIIFNLFRTKKSDEFCGLHFYSKMKSENHRLEIWDMSLASNTMLGLNMYSDIVIVCFDVNSSTLDSSLKIINFYKQQERPPPTLILYGIIIRGRKIHPLTICNVVQKLSRQKIFKRVLYAEDFQFEAAQLQKLIKTII